MLNVAPLTVVLSADRILLIAEETTLNGVQKPKKSV